MRNTRTTVVIAAGVVLAAVIVLLTCPGCGSGDDLAARVSELESTVQELERMITGNDGLESRTDSLQSQTDRLQSRTKVLASDIAPLLLIADMPAQVFSSQLVARQEIVGMVEGAIDDHKLHGH